MNNAGTGGGGTFDDADMTQWRRAIGVNIEGTLHGILAFMPRMLANDEEGYITGTTSGSGAQGTMYSGAPYAATKKRGSQLDGVAVRVPPRPKLEAPRRPACSRR